MLYSIAMRREKLKKNVRKRRFGCKAEAFSVYKLKGRSTVRCSWLIERKKFYADKIMNWKSLVTK